MLRKKDILEIKRLTKDENCHYTKMRGCYISEDGEVRATINETFLNLDESLYYKYLDIAKQIFQPKSIGDKNIELEVENNEQLMNLVECNLEDDEAVENMCSSIAECLDMTQNYLILLFHDDYDVMERTSDNIDLDESEEVYSYILCAVCPVRLEKPALEASEAGINSLERKKIVGKPVEGFVYPAFEERSANRDKCWYYTATPADANHEMMQYALLAKETYTATEYRNWLEENLKSMLGVECANKVLMGLNASMEAEASKEEECQPNIITPSTLESLLKLRCTESEAKKIANDYERLFKNCGYASAGDLYNEKYRDTYYDQKNRERGKELLNTAATALSHVGTLDLAREIEDYLSKQR